jgi:hypothetical protein
MLLDLIAQYYKLLWIAFGAVAFLKIIISIAFNGSLEGINGIIYALFKWYGEEEQEMEDIGRRRMMMRVHNLVTLLLYFTILTIVAATVVPMVLG